MTAPQPATVSSLLARYPNLPVESWADTIAQTPGIKSPDGLLVSCCRRGTAPRGPAPEKPFDPTKQDDRRGRNTGRRAEDQARNPHDAAKRHESIAPLGIVWARILVRVALEHPTPAQVIGWIEAERESWPALGHATAQALESYAPDWGSWADWDGDKPESQNVGTSAHVPTVDNAVDKAPPLPEPHAEPASTAPADEWPAEIPSEIVTAAGPGPDDDIPF